MINNIFAETSDLMEKLVCNANECLSWIIVLINILSVFYLAFCAWLKITKGVKLFGYIWSSLDLCVTVYVVFTHTCIFTILGAVFSGLSIMAMLNVTFRSETATSSSVGGVSGSFEGPGQAPKAKTSIAGYYVLFKTNKENYIFKLFDANKELLLTSKYKYGSFDSAKYAIFEARKGGVDIALEDRTTNWIKHSEDPKLILDQEGKKYVVSYELTPTYVILKSNPVKDVIVSLKAAKRALAALTTDELFISKDIIKDDDFDLFNPNGAANQGQPKKVIEPKKEEIVNVAPIVQTEEEEETVEQSLWLNEDGTPRMDEEFPSFFERMLKGLADDAKYEFYAIVKNGGIRSSIRHPMVEFYKDEYTFLAHFFSSIAFRTKIRVSTYEHLYGRFSKQLTKDDQIHLLNSKMVNIYYLHRNDGQYFVDKVKEFALMDIQNELVKHRKHNYKLSTIKKLILLLTSINEFDEALSYCDLAISKKLIDYKDQGFEGRKEEIIAKKERYLKQQEKSHKSRKNSK